MRRQSPEHIAKRAAAIRATKMGWCPADRAAEHLRNMKVKKMTSAESRRIIEDDISIANRRAQRQA